MMATAKVPIRLITAFSLSSASPPTISFIPGQSLSTSKCSNTALVTANGVVTSLSMSPTMEIALSPSKCRKAVGPGPDERVATSPSLMSRPCWLGIFKFCRKYMFCRAAAASCTRNSTSSSPSRMLVTTCPSKAIRTFRAISATVRPRRASLGRSILISICSLPSLSLRSISFAPSIPLRNSST